MLHFGCLCQFHAFPFNVKARYQFDSIANSKILQKNLVQVNALIRDLKCFLVSLSEKY